MLRAAIVCACILAAVPGSAQVAGPALHEGKEIAVSLTQRAFDPVPSMGSGLAATYRRVGRVNLSARYASDIGDGSFAEVGSFGAITTLPAGVELGWNAGLAYSSGQAGIHAPVGVTASRVIRVRGMDIAPFADVRVMMLQLDEPLLDAASFTSHVELGTQVRVVDGWSLRASASTSSNSSGVSLGIARRL